MVTENPTKTPKYSCEICDYISGNKKDYDKHILTAKHLKLTLANTQGDAKIPKYSCTNCDKKYESRNGLWKHLKKCKIEEDKTDSSDDDCEDKKDKSKKDDLIEYLIKENQEFKNLILELAKKDNSVINNNNTNTNCHNTNNNTFNLNMFLNEKCKDAINIDDFISNIKMQLSDLENFGYMGYVEGVSRVLIKNLKDLDTYSRPIHCSDLKREVFYIKDNNEWTKETDDKPVLKNVIKQVANKNIKQIQTWKNEHPDCTHSDSKKNDQYINIVMNSMSGGTSEEQQNNISQIVKNISKAVAIEKKAIL